MEESSLLIMAFSLRHKITDDCLGDILSLINLHMPIDCLSSKYKFKKTFSQFTNEVTCQYYCSVCHKYLGLKEVQLCCVCQTKFDSDISQLDCFLTLSLKSQLKTKFEMPQFVDALAYRFQRCKTDQNNIDDIFDGRMYKANVALQNPNNISLSWNTDGVPIFSSSSFSAWPIQCLINELPPLMRKENVMLVGMWFGPQKPDMATFLKPFIEECNDLQTNGLTWLDNTDKTTKNSLVYTICCSVDAVARYSLQNSTQFNGKYGCIWCTHPGQVIPKGRGHVRAYPILDPIPNPRTHISVVKNAAEASEREAKVLGINGPSVLLLLKSFDIVNGFVVDYMHCVLLGVTRQLTKLWFNSMFHEETWYIGRKISYIDQHLITLKPPKEITRTPRSLSTIKYWKASEWRHWLLYYSPILLNGILPNMFYNHLCLLVSAMFILLQQSISLRDIQTAKTKLILFVIQMEQLYGLQHVSYNCHQLTHIASSVLNWGPLWATSCFIFESNNRVLKGLFHGTQAVSSQIMRGYCLLHCLPVLAIRSEISNTAFVKYFLKMTGHSLPIRNSIKLDNSTIILGQPVKITVKRNIKLLIDMLEGRDLESMLIAHCRIIVNSVLYSSRIFNRKHSKRNNFTVKTKGQVFGEIDYFILTKCCITCLNCNHGSCYVVLNHYDVISPFVNDVPSLKRMYNNNSQIIVKDEDLASKCIHLACKNNILVFAALPNNYERD